MCEEKRSAKERLIDVLNTILSPVHGCWTLHDGHYDYEFDANAALHILEVWPIGRIGPEESKGNGHRQRKEELVNERAEFDFTNLAKHIPLQYFQFSQQSSLFEIGWEENGQKLHLRIHISPLNLNQSE